MSDPYDQDLFLSYLEGELTPQDEGRFEVIMGKDDRLRRLVTQLQADRQMLRTLPQAEVPPGLMDPVRERLERDMLLGDVSAQETEPQRSSGTWGRWAAYSGVAALVAISATVVLLILASSRSIWEQGDGEFVAIRSATVSDRKPSEKKSTDEKSQIVSGQLAMVDGRASDLDDGVHETDSVSRSLAASDDVTRDSDGADRDAEKADDNVTIAGKPAVEMPTALAEAMDDGPAPGAAPVVGAALALLDSKESPGEVDIKLQPAKDGAGTELGADAAVSNAEPQIDTLAKAPERLEVPASTADGPVPAALASRGDEWRGSHKLSHVAPTARMQIVAKDPNQARQHLMSWASARRLRVKALAEQRTQAWTMRGRSAAASAGSARRLDAVYVVHANAAQTRQLLGEMQRAENQTASLALLEPNVPHPGVAATTQPATPLARRTLRANTELEADVAALEPQGLSTDKVTDAPRSLGVKEVAEPTPSGEATPGTAPVTVGDLTRPQRLTTAPRYLTFDPEADVTLRLLIHIRRRVAADEESTKPDGPLEK